MSAVSPVQNSFTGGEISPLMLGRFDHDIWAVSLLECLGWMPLPQGPIEACPGTEFIASAAGPCRLIAFEPYVTQAYVIEASAAKFRFYTNDALVMSGPTALEVIHPYSFSQVKAFDYTQSNDVLYFWHKDVAPKALVRTGAGAFALEDFAFKNGPYQDRNLDETITVQASATDGSVTLLANSALFEAGDVGGLFEIEFIDLVTIAKWEPGMTVTSGMLCVSVNGNVYQHAGGTRTGSDAPRHARGTELDGMKGTDINSKGPYGCSWTYRFNAFGRLKITGYISATQVTATVLQRLASTNASWRWRFGAFSPRRGWPEHGAIFNERLVLSKGDTRYASQIGLFDDFDRFNENLDIGDDQAIVVPLTNPNPIAWLHGGTELFTGGATEENVLRPASAAKGLAAGNVRNIIGSDRGSASVRPIVMDGRPIFVQRNCRKLLYIVYADYDRFSAEDLMRYADHIGNSPLIELALQKEPHPIAWAVRADGSLAGCLMMPDEQVLGWFRRELGGEFLARSVCAVTAPTGKREDVWIAAQYGGQWVILKMAAVRDAGQFDDNAVMVDAALAYEGISAQVFSGLSHLAGRTVTVVADGAVLNQMSVASNGTLDIGMAASKAVIGLSFPARFQTLPVEAGGDSGPANMKIGKTTGLILRVQNSLGLKVTVDNEANTSQMLENQQTNSDLGRALPFITRDIRLQTVGAFDNYNTVVIERVAPKQSTILAVMHMVEKAQTGKAR